MDWTKEGCEQAALASHEEAIGIVRTIKSVEVGSPAGARQYFLSEPASVRVLRTPLEFLLVWDGDFLDARWCVELLQETEATKVLADDMIWIYVPISWELGKGPQGGTDSGNGSGVGG